MPLPTLFFSNRVECLFAAVAPSLYASPFGKKVVIVPSLAMKQWISEKLVHHPDYQISFGYFPLLLHQAVPVINEWLGERGQPAPSQSALGWKLQAEIDRILREEKDTPFFREVVEYCSKRPQEQSSSLALKLAKLFHEYEENAPQEMAELAQKPAGDFQHFLWSRIHGQRDLLPGDSTESGAMEIHLFAVSYLSPALQQFFEKIHPFVSVHYWILSPSRFFWEDQLTNREKLSWMKKWQGKEEDLEAFEAFLASGNPFLSQNGKAGRHWLKRLEAFQSESAECYLISDHCETDPAYSERMVDGVHLVNEPWTLLSAVQADLALLRNPGESPSEIVDRDSIQVHSASSPLREVEALYHALNHLLETHPQLNPHDIVVLAAEFDRYEPLLRMVFGRNGSRLKMEILEASLMEAPLIVQFRRLLELSRAPLEKTSLFQLLGEPVFWEKKDLSGEEFGEFKGWFEKANPLSKISTGLRKKLIDHFAKQGNLGFSSAEAFGQWIQLLEQMEEDLRSMREAGLMTLAEWAEKLKELLERYVLLDSHEEEARYLLQYVRTLGQQETDERFSYKTVYAHVMAELTRNRGLYQEQKQQAVRVSSLLPMRAVPAKVVALLGMNQGVVPKTAEKSSLDHFTQYAPKIARVLPSDFDRYLFMESLLSARDHLLIFYTRPEGSSSPSIVVEELLHFLDEGYTIEGKCPSELIVREHPEQSFDPAYFMEGPLQINHSLEDYEAALAYSLPRKNVLEPLSFGDPKKRSDGEIPHEITLEALEGLLSNPLKLFQKEKLGVYPKKREEEAEALDDFDAEDFLAHRLKSDLFFHSSEHLLQQAVDEGKVPQGLIGDAFVEKYRCDLEDQNALLLRLNLGTEFFKVELTHGVEKGQWISPQLFQSPPLYVNYEGKNVAIVGTLPICCRQGLISMRSTKLEDRFKELCREWVLYHLPEELIERKVHSVKDTKSKQASEPQWELLIDHYLRSKLQPVPLLPKLVGSLAEGDASKVSKSWKDSVENSFFGTKDHHLNWMLKRHSAPDPEQMIRSWQDYAASFHQEDS